jgi:hypothetical protein
MIIGQQSRARNAEMLNNKHVYEHVGGAWMKL